MRRHPFLIHHYLERSAARAPQSTAVVDGERSLDYAGLDRQSSNLAADLHSLGVGAGDRVGIFMNKSLEAVVAIYGILKTGACYVPMDPSAPVSRLGYMASNCGMRVVVTGADKAASWSGLVESSGGVISQLVTFAPPESPVEIAGVGCHTLAGLDQRAERIDVRATEDDLAYILYTSGSTGDPKGVMLSHANCRAFVDWAVDEFEVAPEDRLSSHAPFHFDLSTFDLFAASSAGATVVLVPAAASVFPIEVRRFIETNEITVWYSVPSILTLMTEHGGVAPGAFPSLRTILFAGEVFPTKYLSRIMRFLPDIDFVNLYGPTETNVCTWYRVPDAPEEDDPPISIGRAIDNVETFVVGEDDSELPPGIVGELLVRGPTVMKGYWGDDERTAQRRVTSPLSRHLGDPVYRTGDLVEEQPDGNYRFLGRRDNQIKSRGYRIELGDIESVISSHPAVIECGVVAVPDEMITNRLECYVSTSSVVSVADLKQHCLDRLPRYMVPEHFEFLDDMPKTSTGKIDRQTLLSASER